MIIAGGIQPTSRNRSFGPFRSAAGNLYYVAFQEFDADGVLPFEGAPSGGPNLISVWKSADAGLTWIEQDAANRKPSAIQDANSIYHTAGFGYNVVQDLRTFEVVRHPVATDELWVLYVDDTDAYRVSVFDMATDAWSATSGSGIACVWGVLHLPAVYFNPSVNFFSAEFETTTGDFVVLAVTGGVITPAHSMHNVGQVFRLQGGIAGAWTVPVTIPLILGSTYTEVAPAPDNAMIAVVRGAAGRVHAVFTVIDDADDLGWGESRLVHWLIADGAGGAGVALDTLFTSPAALVGAWNLGWDDMIGLGGPVTGCSSSIPFGGGVQVVIPVIRVGVLPADPWVLELMYGDSQPAMPLAAWSFQPVDGYPPGVMMADYTTVVDSGVVYVGYRRPSDEFLVERSWDGAALGPIVEVLPFPWATVGAWAHTSSGVSGSHGYIYSAIHPVVSVWGMAWVAAPAPAPPAPVVAIPSPNFIRFGKSPIKCANVWDWCLENDQRLWSSIVWAQHGCIPPKCWILEDNPLHAIPEQGREFSKYGAIDLPPLPSVDTQIFQFRVPLGYDGVIYALLCKYTGLGYVNGSGDIVWRFRINDHWIRSMRAIPTELGDYSGYMQLDEFFKVQSGQVIRAYGWVSPLSGLMGGSMIAALQGWYFPTQFER